MPADSNPFLSAAMEDAADPTDGIEFLVAKAINRDEPELCYSEDLVKLLAVAHKADLGKAIERLKRHFKTDFSPQTLRDSVAKHRVTEAVAYDDGLLRTSTGSVRPILANALTQLQRSPIRIGFDMFAARMQLLEASPWCREGRRYPADWTDNDDYGLTNYLQHQGVFVENSTAHQAGSHIAKQNSFHPVVDWFNSIDPWDGVPRIENWLTTYLGVSRGTYEDHVGAAWLTSCVARVFEPGCKADHVLVFEGEEGMGKSQALRALANGHIEADTYPQWFTDHLPPIDHPGCQQALQGVWIIEESELDSVRKAHWSAVKKFFTIQTDRFREPYGHNVQSYPRQCVFAASTNEDKWVPDPTARRFWPVRPTKIDIEGIIRDRSQLWAEARVRYQSNKGWWLPPEVELLARAEQFARYNAHPWTDGILEWVENQWINHVETDHMGKTTEYSVTTERIIETVLNKAIGIQTRGDKDTVQRIMHLAGKWTMETGAWRRRKRKGA